MEDDKQNELHIEEGLAPKIDVEENGLEPIDLEAEKRLLRKLDWHILPPLGVLYLITFLDRTNIGNAKIQGLTQDLQMTGTDYNIALMIFFIPYILLEIPANILLKHVRPSRFLCSIVILWGICTIGQGLVRTKGGLYAMRLLIGTFEAGYLPGCIYLISMYYKRFELQWRLTMFLITSVLAGAFGGLLAYAIANLNGIGGYGGWRWIFIIEGLLTVVIGGICLFLVVDWPETVKFLNDEERALLHRRLASDSEGGSARMDHLNKRAARRIYTDWKVYVGTLMYFGIVNSGNAVFFFTPTIINEMGFTASQSQIRAIPVFLASSFIPLCVAYLSDRVRHRFWFAQAGIAVALIGYIIVFRAFTFTVGVRYMACFFSAIGTFIAQPLIIVWVNNNMSGHYKRAISAGAQIGLGNIGGLVASNIYFAWEAPEYPTGNGVTIALLVFCSLMCCVFYYGSMLENRKRDRGERDYRMQEADLGNQGDDDASYRFVY